MIRFNAKTMQKLGIGLVLAAAPVLTAHAEYRCDPPRTNLDARVCSFAEQGPSELRRFIERTRMIYALSFRDYRRAEVNTGVAQSDSETSTPVAMLSSRPNAARQNRN
jgi:hypothetical protein